MHRISGILHAAPMCALSGLHASQKYTLVLNKTCPKECICRIFLAKPLCGHSHIDNINDGWQRANRRLQRLIWGSTSLSAHSGHPVWLLAPNRRLLCCCTRSLKEQLHPFRTVAHIRSLQLLLCVQVRSGARDCPECPTVSIRVQHFDRVVARTIIHDRPLKKLYSLWIWQLYPTRKRSYSDKGTDDGQRYDHSIDEHSNQLASAQPWHLS
jgi:hypothetical protein